MVDVNEQNLNPRSALRAQIRIAGEGEEGLKAPGGRSCLESGGDVRVAGELTSASV